MTKGKPGSKIDGSGRDAWNHNQRDDTEDYYADADQSEESNALPPMAQVNWLQPCNIYRPIHLTPSAATPGRWRSIATETLSRRWLTRIVSERVHQN